jgi:NAD(P)H-nitrite reductase large subunit
VKLEDGRELGTDLLVICAGARAELDLAHAAGLASGRGITVDAQMRTSASGVFAAGDVAEFEGRQHGLWSVAMAQGEVAARSALGKPARYEPVQPVTSLKLPSIEVRSAGVVRAGQPGERELLCTGPARDAAADADASADADDGKRYCKLVVEKRSRHQRVDRLTGVVIVGPHEGEDELLEAARRRGSLRSVKDALARHRWLLASAKATARVA